MNTPTWVHTEGFQKLKHLFFAALYRVGFFDLVRALSNRLGRQGVILCYHRVIEGEPDPYSIPGTQVDRQRFIAQVRGFSSKFRIIPFSRMVEKLKSGRIDSDELVLSFDDGFKDNASIVYPILRRFRVPAIFFISPAMLGSNALIWNNRIWFFLNRGRTGDLLQWRNLQLPLGSQSEKLLARDLINQDLAPMTEKQREAVFEQMADALCSPSSPPEKAEIMITRDDIAAMGAGSVAEFGSHSLTHPLLPLTNDAQRRQEVEESKKKLEEILGRPVAYFAYPGGAYDEKTVQSVRRAGYEAAVTTRDGLISIGDDLFTLSRVNVVRDDTLFSLMIRKLVPLYLRNIGSTLKKRLYGDRRDSLS